MRYRGRFPENGGERTRSVELLDGTRYPQVALDGAAERYDAVATGGNGWSILAPDGRQVEATVHRDANEVRVHVGAEVFTFEFLDELTALALAATGRKAGGRAADVKAAIPGRVLRILVAPGDEVPDGAPLLVLEAMKMENEVRAHRGGRVRSIEVAPGQAVATGDLLVRFEA